MTELKHRAGGVIRPHFEQTAKEPHSGRGPRVMLYSHDALGLGHARRNLLLAKTILQSHPHADILMVTGALESIRLAEQLGIECVVLPALRKDAQGQYAPRRLHATVFDVIDMRAKIIGGAVDAFAPDILVVDKQPRGILRELQPTLELLRTIGGTHTVLGLRDILDAPDTVRQEWIREGYDEAIAAYYDEVWVYGDPYVYDQEKAYRLPPQVARKILYTGYLDQRERLRGRTLTIEGLMPGGLPPGKMVLCMVGGGEDGMHIAEAFSRTAFPQGTYGLLVTGPYMPEAHRNHFRACADQRDDFFTIEFVDEPTLLVQHASHIVCMGGYSTMCEVVSFGKRALVVPRVQPRKEQWMRAQRFYELGLVDVLHPRALTPEALSAWLQDERRSPTRLRKQVDFTGLACIQRQVDRILAAPSPSSSPCGHPVTVVGPPTVWTPDTWGGYERATPA